MGGNVQFRAANTIVILWPALQGVFPCIYRGHARLSLDGVTKTTAPVNEGIGNHYKVVLNSD